MEDWTIKNLVKFDPDTDSLVMRIKSYGKCAHLFKASERKLVNAVFGYLNSINGVDVYLTGGILEKQSYSDIDMIAVGEKNSLDKIGIDLFKEEMAFAPHLMFEKNELNFSRLMKTYGLKDISVKEERETHSDRCKIYYVQRFKIENYKHSLAPLRGIDLSLVETSNFKTYVSK